jgi:hypothetical protein
MSCIAVCWCRLQLAMLQAEGVAGAELVHMLPCFGVLLCARCTGPGRSQR